jgi:hypothetical protein
MGRSCGRRPPWLGSAGGQRGSETGEIVGGFLIMDAGCSGGQSPGGQKACGGCAGALQATVHAAGGAGPPSTRCARCWATGWAAQAAGDAGVLGWRGLLRVGHALGKDTARWAALLRLRGWAGEGARPRRGGRGRDLGKELWAFLLCSSSFLPFLFKFGFSFEFQIYTMPYESR